MRACRNRDGRWPGRPSLLAGLLAVLCWSAATGYGQQTFYVNGAPGQGNDAWDGLCEVWDGGTCGPRATIQAGIDAASSGDTVIVADFTYTGADNKNLELGIKSLTIRSADGPDNCIIDCENAGRGFNVMDNGYIPFTVDGFTITRASEMGGGVNCKQASPTINNCKIIGNTASSYPGIFCCDCYEDALVVITNCTISGNTCSGVGGGIYCLHNTSVTIDNCIISDNVADDGGGLRCQGNTDLTISNCTITGNTASVGGGLHLGTSQVGLMTNCTISGNSATEKAGGLYLQYSSLDITNCTITDNTVDPNGDGGGLYCYMLSNPAIANCTIAGNTVSGSGQGAGLCVRQTSYPTIGNCILWNGGDEIYNDAGCTTTVSYSDVQAAGLPGDGNIDVDPAFVDPDGPDNDPATWPDNDYHLAPDSPCIEAGDPSGDYSDQTDVDGDQRVLFEIVDMGSDEAQAFTDCNENGSPDWQDLAAGPSQDTNGNGVPDECECGSLGYTRADANCDGAVNTFDIDAFVQALVDPGAWLAEPTHTCALLCVCDVNCDGRVDTFDIDPFVECLTGSCPPCP